MKIAVVAGAALLLAGSAAHTEPSALARACATDIKSVCADVAPGGGALKDCVKAHFSDLSATCQIAIVRAAEVGRACKGDVLTFCSNVEPGKGAVADCMKSHAADLSEPCKEAMAKTEGEGSSGNSGATDLPAPQATQPKSIGIALQPEGGTLLVPIVVNGAIKLNFIIDSGSAVVSVPADVVMTLIRTGTIRDGDFRGSTTYVLADGSTIPSPNFNI